MPVKVKKIGDKFRIVEGDDSIVKNKGGTAVDGGGHVNKRKAMLQASAINANTNPAPPKVRKKKKSRRRRRFDKGQDLA